MERQYPCVKIHTARLGQNAREVVSRCHEMGVSVCGVIKGCGGMPEVARLFREAGADEIGTSRLEQVAACREAGIDGPYLLLRVPGLTELGGVVALCDTSLQSERATLDALEQECARQGKSHSVIIMADLGDLREGFWDKEEMAECCVHVERDLPHVHLKGVGVNLGCYGSIKPTPEKMEALLTIARDVEGRIGRKLEVISGGATSSYRLVHDGTMPAGINHLRIGEGILLAKDLQVDWGITDMDYLRMDTFTLHGEVLEIRRKPSYPQGEFAIDAFGHKPVYVDRGPQIRALIGFGRADVGDVESLICCEAGMTVIGGSSDHCIVDATACRPLQVGDVVEFHLCYSHMLYATGRSDVRFQFVAD